jgi:phage FluMu protein Com
MDITIERLEEALTTMAKIATSRADGEAYLPICKKLEAEISRRKEATTYLEKMRTLAAKVR